MRFVEGLDRSQSTLFPETLEEFVAEDNPVRVIEAFVEGLDLGGLGFERVDPKATGRPAYHRSVLLKLYIYGYLNRVQSSRRLEREAGRNVEVMWLTGRLVPDRKTIADFRKDNGAQIRQVCAQFVVLCRRLGLLAQGTSGASVAIDGSKSKAVNNRDGNFTAAKMKRRMAQIEESVARYLGQLDSADRQEPSEALAMRTTRLKQKISSALQHAHSVLSQAIFGYAMLRSIALRFRDSSLIGEGNTGDIAEQHTKNYVAAVHKVNQILHNVVLWELDRDGASCQCTCPSCGLGICMCAQGPRRTLSDIWAELGPISDEAGVFVHPPRSGSAAAEAGLRHGDVIVAADGQTLDSHFTLQGIVSGHQSGEAIELRVLRDSGEQEDVAVVHP